MHTRPLLIDRRCAHACNVPGPSYRRLPAALPASESSRTAAGCNVPYAASLRLIVDLITGRVSVPVCLDVRVCVGRSEVQFRDATGRTKFESPFHSQAAAVDYLAGALRVPPSSLETARKKGEPGSSVKNASKRGR